MNAKVGEARSIYSIQYLRGIAAFSVLIDHVFNWPLPEHNTIFLMTGRLGVEVFFVISGFIITTIGGAGTFKPGEFVRRRATRIVPIYWLATIAVVVLALAMPNQFRTTVVTAEGFIKSLLFIPSIEPKAPLFALGWTLNYEAFFYAVFACLFFTDSSCRTLIICVLFGSLVIIGQLLPQTNQVVAVYTSPSLIGFCAGTILAEAYRRGVLQYLQQCNQLLVVAGVLVPVALYYLGGRTEVASLQQHLVLTLAGLAIVSVALHAELAGMMPRINILQLFGDASYSLYLFHLFAVAGVWAMAKQLPFASTWVGYLLIAAVALVAGTMSGLLVYRFLEHPILMWAAALRRRQQSQPRTSF
jgi:exopolysaccharide production protein ExoZ